MAEEKVDVQADLKVSIPEELSPTGSSSLEMVFNKSNSLIKTSKQDNTDYISSQKKKTQNKLDYYTTSRMNLDPPAKKYRSDNCPVFNQVREPMFKIETTR